MKKAILITFAILGVIIIALFILLGVYTDRVIDPYVRSLLNTSKPMNHKVEYAKIKVNLFKGVIKVKDVRMYPDSSLVKTERLWIDLKVSTIELTDFRIWDILLHKALIIGDLEMLNPSVEVHLPVEKPQEILEDLEVKEKKKEKSPLLTSITLQRIYLADGTFKLIRNDVVLASSPDINLVIDDIKLKKDSQNDPIGYTYGEVNLLLYNIALYSETGLYDMSLGSFEVSKGDSTIILKDFRMIPKYDKKEHYKNLKYTKERFDVKIGEIAVSGFGFGRVLAGFPLDISAIRIDNVDADIYKDKNLPFDLTKFPLFYNESFVNIPIPIRIDTVEIANSKLLYNELTNGRTEIGSIVLENFALQVYDLTNMVKEDDTITNEMHLYIQALVMGEGNMNVEVILPLEGNLRRLECSGSVGAMRLSPLNSFLEPSLNIKFNDGKVNRMTFFYTGDDNKTRGWMEFLYNDVDIVLLKKDQEKEWGVASFLANQMTHSNNPLPGKEPKTVEIGCDRDKNKGLINYVWRTIQSGMIRTILPSAKYNISKQKADAEKSKAKEKDKKKKAKT
jgi:hypothetical protein